jgi:hypothetical protein
MTSNIFGFMSCLSCFKTFRSSVRRAVIYFKSNIQLLLFRKTLL